ncbi:unnamed protein product [Scytosiphon promiscuus]
MQIPTETINRAFRRRRHHGDGSDRGSPRLACHDESSPPSAAATAPAAAELRRRSAPSCLTKMSTAVVATVFAYCLSSAPLRTEAFFAAPPATAFARAEGFSTTATTLMTAKGFGKSVEPPPPPPPPSPSPATKGAAGGAPGGEGGVKSWEKEYKAYIKRTGQYLCSMSWEGHEEMGRGAIFANYDDARKEGKLNETEKFGGIPSMYVPLTEFESMKAAGQEAGEGDDLAQIVRRVKDYRPEREFVVVFQAAGVMGADIVRPSVSPPEMAKHVVKSDGVSTMPSASGLDGVIDVN